ncbi:MAG: hypothetical protein J7M26_00440 [Armatimonadetes bacterium]|nr:hypothetical protein [Armatimonadota bacterium]
MRRRPSACRPDLPTSQDAAKLLARQQRQHFLALYIAARDYARQLEEAVLSGKSPTGYGAALTPLPPEQAEAVLGPVREYLEALREFVRLAAPEDLAEFEGQQSATSTAVWASNLLERLRYVADDLAPQRLKKYGAPRGEVQQRAEKLRRELIELLNTARSALGDDLK